MTKIFFFISLFLGVFADIYEYVYEYSTDNYDNYYSIDYNATAFPMLARGRQDKVQAQDRVQNILFYISDSKMLTRVRREF
jgi:hypothetical protein